MSGRTLRVWLDAQLPPDLATWLSSTFEVAAEHVVDLGLLHATDESIFARARAENAVVMTKDADFVQLVERLGAPPRVVWLTVGNISNAELRAALQEQWLRTAQLLLTGEPLVEITRR